MNRIDWELKLSAAIGVSAYLIADAMIAERTKS